MNRWLFKTEPEEYSFVDLEKAGKGRWDGVRSRQAQAYLARSRPGDAVLFYHTGKERAIVAIAEVVSSPYPDPTAGDPKYAAVDIAPVKRLPWPVTLREIKADPAFAGWQLVHLPRLSVMPVSNEHWERVLAMSQAKEQLT